ncbi:MAG: hypothetical protein M3128_03255 [Verrucomicrobiota bacterium]|nr:hypothetical protein [Verrucomicrobiota bacterium]
MTTTTDAIYEDGKILLPEALPLPDKSHVIVTIESSVDTVDPERSAWLRRSEESLTETWDNTDDDVFNKLLTK